VPIDLEVGLLEVFEFLDRGVAFEIGLDDLTLLAFRGGVDFAFLQGFIQLHTGHIAIELEVIGAGAVNLDLGIETDRDIAPAQ